MAGTWKKLAFAEDVHNLPSGGSTGQALTKQSATDYDAAWTSIYGSLGITIDGGDSAITTGVKGYVTAPHACTIIGWYITGDPAGSIVIDVWKKAGAIPANADSITGSELPTLSGGATANDANLTTWTTAIAAGDIIGFNVDSCTSCQKVTLVLATRK